jgi:hypothetical protein
MPSSFLWSPGIGAALATAALYFITAWRCCVVARAQGRLARTTEREYLAWWVVAIVFLVLGINRQFDLESVLTRLGRSLLYHGWTEYKFAIQVGFIGVALGICTLMSLVLFVLFRGAHPAARLALLGAVLVVGFVAVRTSSLHDIDQFIDTRFLKLRWNWILETGCILLVLTASVWRMSRHRIVDTGGA